MRSPQVAGIRRSSKSWGPSDYLLLVAMVLVVGLWIYTRVWPDESHQPSMPTKVEDEAERQLYLEPGGLYTAADIAANGGLTASQKFAGFKPSHDFDPQPGDLLCPVTRTKANPACEWTIDGRQYTFCCPPCVDEFLELAKRDPQQVQDPEKYVK